MSKKRRAIQIYGVTYDGPLYSVMDVARACERPGKTIYYWIDNLNVPGPDIVHRRRVYYDLLTFKQVVKLCKN